MKLLFSTILLGFVLTQVVYAQHVPDGVYTKSDSDLTQVIDKLCIEIRNNLPSYQKTQVVADKENARNVFKKKNEIILITVKSIDKNIEKKVSWYYDNGKLIFCEQIWLDNSSYVLVDHEKFYIDNGRLISWVKDNTPIDYTSDDFRKIDNWLATYADKLKYDSMK